MISQLNRIARPASLAALLVPRTDLGGPFEALPRSLLGERRPFKGKTLGALPPNPCHLLKKVDENFHPDFRLFLAKGTAASRQAYQNQSKIP